MAALSMQDPLTPPPLPPKKRSLGGSLSPMGGWSISPFSPGWGNPPALPDLVPSQPWLNESFDSVMHINSLAMHGLFEHHQASSVCRHCLYATFFRVNMSTFSIAEHGNSMGIIARASKRRYNGYQLDQRLLFVIVILICFLQHAPPVILFSLSVFSCHRHFLIFENIIQ